MRDHLAMFSSPSPTPEEVRAAIARAHRERSEAMRSLLGALFRRRKASGTEPAVHAETVACR